MVRVTGSSHFKGYEIHLKNFNLNRIFGINLIYSENAGEKLIKIVESLNVKIRTAKHFCQKE